MVRGNTLGDALDGVLRDTSVNALREVEGKVEGKTEGEVEGGHAG